MCYDIHLLDNKESKNIAWEMDLIRNTENNGSLFASLIEDSREESHSESPREIHYK